MARTTAEAVRDTLLADYNTADEPSLTQFINDANLVVTRVATCATAKGESLTTDELEAVERYLAAHLYCMTDPAYQEKKTEKAEAKFVGKTGMRLEATRYGQSALMLDYSGCLLAIANRTRVGITWLGKTESEQLTYDERND